MTERLEEAKQAYQVITGGKEEWDNRAADFVREHGNWLLQQAEQRDQALSFLESLKRGGCWCGVGLGNPNYKGKHTENCKEIQTFMWGKMWSTKNA